MDEVWKDINFSSFQEHSPVGHLRSPNFRSINFQHFLSRPFSTASSSRYGSPVPPPATMLTLNTIHDSQLFRSNNSAREVPLVQHHTIPQINICPHSSMPVDFFPSSNGKKRQPEIDSSNSDRRHKRMIKNRDAAARSRARKQAYTDELELEVAYLVGENARLRKQQKQLCLAAAAQQPKKRKFCRATSAPL